MADRFFTAESLELGPFVLEGPEAHHLAHVRRMETGEFVALFNGDGREFRAEILEIEKKRVHLEIVQVNQPVRELPCSLHLGVALPKGDRGDFLIEKLTELGVADFTPLLAVRSVVQPKEDKIQKLQRAVIEASKQCGRNVLMRIHPPMSLEKWCSLNAPSSTKWIAHPDGAALNSNAVGEGGITIAIGPEGGLTAEELDMAKSHGFRSVNLGHRILRVETAALAVAAYVGLASSAI